MQAGRIVELGDEVESWAMVSGRGRTVRYDSAERALLESCSQCSLLARLPIRVGLGARIRSAENAHGPGCLAQSSLGKLDPLKEIRGVRVNVGQKVAEPSKSRIGRWYQKGCNVWRDALVSSYSLLYTTAV